MLKACLFLILLSISPLFAQQVLVSKSGAAIKIKHFTSKSDVLDVKPIEGKRFDVKPETVFRIHDIDKELSYIPGKRENNWGESVWVPIEVREDGPLQLFRVAEKKGLVSDTQSWVITYFVGKGDSLIWSYIKDEIFNSKKKLIEALKSLVIDDPGTLAELNSEDFKLNEESLARVVRLYNVNKWQRPAAGQSMGICFFYLKANGTGPGKATLVVNEDESKEVTSTRPTMISLPLNVPSKVCLGEYCQTVTPNPYFAYYFQIDDDEDPRKTVFENIFSQRARREIQYRNEKAQLKEN